MLGLPDSQDRPLRRLDRLLFRQEPEQEEWEVTLCERMGYGIEIEVLDATGRPVSGGPNAREGKIWASDHEGLVTVLSKVQL